MSVVDKPAKLIEIPAGRGCTYMLYMKEILQNLPQDILAMGLRRGKAIARRRTYEERLRKLAR